MNVIAQKIRKYRSTTRPAVFFAVGTLVFWLTIILIFLVLAAVALNMYTQIVWNSEMYSNLPKIAFIAEFMLLPAMLQIYFEGAQIRYRLLYPEARRVGFRVPELMIQRDKTARIDMIFKPKGSYEQLAKELIAAWEWRNLVKKEADEPAMRRALGFFSLPSASNIATYIAGVLAIAAATIITLIDKDSFYRELATNMNDAWSNIVILTILVVIPVAVSIIPLTTIYLMLKSIVTWLQQRIDDDYIDQRSFYKFILELIQINDRKERRLLMRTTGLVYWLIRIGTARILDIKKVFKNYRRCVRIEKIRSARVNGSSFQDLNRALPDALLEQGPTIPPKKQAISDALSAEVMSHLD